jgi:hypothetical protein
MPSALEAVGETSTGGTADVIVRITGVTLPSARVEEEDVIKILGGGVLKDGDAASVVDVSVDVDVGVFGSVREHELPQRVVICEDVMGTVTVTVSTTVLVPPVKLWLQCPGRPQSTNEANLEFLKR